MSTSPHELSFSTGGLFLTESVKLAAASDDAHRLNLLSGQGVA